MCNRVGGMRRFFRAPPASRPNIKHSAWPYRAASIVCLYAVRHQRQRCASAHVSALARVPNLATSVREHWQLRTQCEAGHELQHARAVYDAEHVAIERWQPMAAGRRVVAFGVFGAEHGHVPLDRAQRHVFEVCKEIASKVPFATGVVLV